MNDILPQQTAIWQYLESTMAKVTSSYGYGEIRTPIVEHVELFKRSIGEVTDIIEKEMYILNDRNGEMLALRPEGTASIVRAGQEHGLLYNQTQRFWYKGPMFRYEKPQKGRYRQFQQLGVESFGMAGADIDAEVILLCASLWRELGILDSLTLELNSIGSNEARKNYREALVKYLADRKEELDPDSQKRLTSNPLRILDSKDAKTQQILDDAPSLTEYLDDDSRQHFADLCSILEGAGIQYVVNPRLVRGLDYYCKTVFEWTTDQLGAQGTVCAGGRYDGLVEQLGGRATPGVGMAMGAERLILLLETLDVVPSSLRHSFDYYLAAQEKGLEKDLILLAERLRSELPGKRIKVHCAGLKNIASKAKQTGASKIVLLNRSGDQLNASLITDEQTQHDIRVDQLVKFL